MQSRRPYSTRLQGPNVPAIGKLRTLGAQGQAHEGDDTAHKPKDYNIIVSPIAPTGCFKLHGLVNGEPMSFLLDTGAAVTLLARDAWTRIDPKRSTKLEPWTEYRLVGVDGSPLQVYGQARVDIELEGEKLSGDVVVVSPLTSEAILGLDFLRRHDAVIKVKEKQLTLGGNDCVLPLSEANSLSSSSYLPIRAVETIEVPPYSEMDVMATVEQPAAGVWLLEGVAEGRPAALTARALVTPRSGQVRVRLLNPRPERVKIYKGSKIATLEEVDEPVTQIAAVGTMEQEAVPPGKEAMLRELVEKAGPELSVSERNEFFHLLLTYADVFASSEADLGRTGVIGMSDPPFE